MEFFHRQGKLDRAPVVETCIQWEMKFGLYKLTRPKAVADDWIWIADHVVSKGVHKCLVVLGVRMSTLLKKDDLTVAFEDVEPLGIVPMKTSNGSRVPDGKRVLGSSEIIESLFGKHKSVSEKGPKPMGRQILSMASRVGERPSHL